MSRGTALVAALACGLHCAMNAGDDHARWLATMPPVPEFVVPSDRAAWEARRTATRAELFRLLGDFPARPSPAAVVVESREEREGVVVERFRFDNGLGERVPGILVLPATRRGRVPAILYNHWHGGEYGRGKAEIFRADHTPRVPATALAALGHAVLAIDAPCFGEREGAGPDGQRGGAGESGAAKFNLWAGRTLWGLMLRDDLCALDYLAARPEIDPARVGAMGMSMGATRTWWLMALDDRIRAGVAVACLTRYQDLVAEGGLRHHGIYYFVPGMLRRFDAEAVVACAAPRALLCLNGDRDAGSPVEGIRRIERAAAPAWSVGGHPERFRSEVFPGVGHEYTPEMWEKTVRWFAEHL